MSESTPGDMEKGCQPLDEILTRLNLKNSELVAASKEQLTHKMVAKGRRGRKLTLNARVKILKAINAAQSVETFKLQQLFNYE